MAKNGCRRGERLPRNPTCRWPKPDFKEVRLQGEARVGEKGGDAVTSKARDRATNFRSSPWILGAPQSGLASAILRIRSWISEPIGGRPGLRRLDFQVQKSLKPWRCQRMMVSGRTRHKALRQAGQRRESQTQKKRSTGRNCGRLERCRRRASCCRSARFSSARCRRDLRAEANERSRTSRKEHMKRQRHLEPSPRRARDRNLANHSLRTMA